MMAMLAGVALWLIHRKSKIAAVGVLCVLVSCNALGVAPVKFYLGDVRDPSSLVAPMQGAGRLRGGVQALN